MSHVQKIQGVYRSLDALKAAAVALGGVFVEGATTHAYYGGSRAQCHHKITFPGTSYEVGVVAQSDGTFAVQYDSWPSGGLGQLLGQAGELFRQRYNVEAVKPELTREGYTFVEEVVDGVLTLNAQRAQARTAY